MPATYSFISWRRVAPSAGQALFTTGRSSSFTARRTSASVASTMGRMRYSSLRLSQVTGEKQPNRPSPHRFI